MLVYFASSLFFYMSYLGMDHYIPDYFPDTTAIVTRKYRIANTVKSGALMFLCVPGTKLLYNLVFYPHLNTWNEFNLIGSIYAATDASALVYNTQCHTSTIVHHVVVQLFYYYCYFMDFNMNEGAVRGIGIYCVLSSYAFLVNYRLALRFTPYRQVEYYINEAALFIYITVSVINWVTQCYLMIRGPYLPIIGQAVYVGTLAMTINDDLFLIKFLRKIDYSNKDT
jgi:hypothetical protein